ncbi:MAG TPA: response regulator transcription factor [Anaerolineales bacterium]|nr:response regulator transcription factor [Anaerolineales bacterium]
MNVTILLADDHPFVRRGVRNLLEAEADFSVIGEAEDGLQVVQMAEKLHPDILIVDLMMPNLNGLEVLKQVSKRSPKTRNIVLSMQSADPYVVEAFRSGASGYILKDGAPDELIDAIRQVLLDDRYLSPKLPERLIAALTESRGNAEKDRYETLTNREREIFQMTAEGRTSQEIGDKLMISPRTVEVHRSNLAGKLGIKNQVDLIRFAIKRGILPMDD